MITFVYCCICLLIVCCQTTGIESGEFDYYSNDQPDTTPKVERIRYKPGMQAWMKCSEHHLNKENISWEFKHCKTNHQDQNESDNKSMYKLDYSKGEWKKLDFNRKRKKLIIVNVTQENTGLYRCLYNDSIMKIYVLELAAAPMYEGPPPKVLSVVSSSNSTLSPNTPLVIQCKASSVQPAEIRWLQACVKSCEVPYENRCYRPLQSSNVTHPMGHNIYQSKLVIQSLRNVESATYVCVAINIYGKDFKNITIKGDNSNYLYYGNNSFSLLFLVPLLFVLVPLSIWLCFYKTKKKTSRHLNEHQTQLIKPVA